MKRENEFDETNSSWVEGLRATPQCPLLPELLNGQRSQALEAHVAGCPRCKMELALFAKMDEPLDRAAVEAVSKRLQRINWAEAGRTGIPAKAESVWQGLRRPRFLAPASFAFAFALVLVAVVEVNRPLGKSNLEVPREDAIASQHLRSQQLRGLAPLGQVQSAPDQLRWEKVSGATEYQVRLMEVDHGSIWEGRVTEEYVALSTDTIAKVLPGKRMLWDVRAFTASGKEIASSGTLEFTRSLHEPHKLNRPKVLGL